MAAPNSPSHSHSPPPPPSRGEAVALAYGSGDNAPRVVAKGRGLIAQEIIERAREAGVFVHESPELVALLMQVDLDAHIPPQLYIAVAELLAWLYRIEAGGTATPPEFKGLAELAGKSSAGKAQTAAQQKPKAAATGTLDSASATSSE